MVISQTWLISDKIFPTKFLFSRIRQENINAAIIEPSGQPVLRTDVWGAQRSQFSGPKSLHWSHCTFERWLIAYYWSSTRRWKLTVDPLHIDCQSLPGSTEVIAFLCESESWLLILPMSIIDPSNSCSAWNVWGAQTPPPPPPPPHRSTKCRSGVDWQNYWLLILCVDHLLPTPLPLDQQNADLGWMDRMVDCWSSVLIIDCLSPFPPPPKHTIDTKTALAKWSRFLARCPTFIFFNILILKK